MSQWAESLYALSSRPLTTFLSLLLLLAGAVFLYLQVPGESPWLPPCPFHRLTDLHCPGCGSTRALHRLLHGDLAGALRANALLVASLPPLGFWYVLRLLPPGTWRGLRDKPTPRWLGWSVFVVCMLFFVLRNLPWKPFVWLAPG